jgi:hypothetical protein
VKRVRTDRAEVHDRRMRRLCAVLVLATACSRVNLTKYDATRPETRSTCSTDNGYPIVDIFGTAVFGVTGGLVMAMGIREGGESNDNSASAKNGTIVVIGGATLLAIALSYAFSSGDGFLTTNACRRARG